MDRKTAILVIATLTLVEITVAIVIAYRVYEKVQPTITSLQGNYSGISGLFNLITGKTPATTSTTP